MRARSTAALTGDCGTGKAPAITGSAQRAAVPHDTAAHRSHAWRLTTLTRTRVCPSVPLFSVCGGMLQGAMSVSHGRTELTALGLGQGDWLVLVLVPANRDHPCFGGHLPGRQE